MKKTGSKWKHVADREREKGGENGGTILASLLHLKGQNTKVHPGNKETHTHKTMYNLYGLMPSVYINLRINKNSRNSPRHTAHTFPFFWALLLTVHHFNNTNLRSTKWP